MTAIERRAARAREKIVEASIDALCVAALEYHVQTSGGGADPLMAGAHLRLAAKAYGRARWEAAQRASEAAP